MSKRKIKKYAGLTILNIVFIILCFCGLVPILYALALSLSSQTSALSSGFAFYRKDLRLKIIGGFLWRSLFYAGCGIQLYWLSER